MNYKNFLGTIFFIFITNCSTENLIKNKPSSTLKDYYTNKGFTLIFNDDLYKNKTISNKIDERSLIIFQKNLKKNTDVKITNPFNSKFLLARVGKKTNYPSFNNSVISKRIADELDLDTKEPYIQITVISKNTLFIAKKAKTYDEEKEVANKVPVNSISIDDLNPKTKNKKNKKIKKVFSYSIKIGEFYFKDTALIMKNRIDNETNVDNSKIRKLSENKYRVYLGPFSDINSLQKSFNDIRILEFENIEIIKNDQT